MNDQQDLGSEKLPEVSTKQPGSYMGITGRTYKYEGKNRTGIATDFFLVNRTNETGSIVHNLLDYKSVNGAVGVSFLKDKSDKIMVNGILIRHSCVDSRPDDTESAIGFFVSIRKKFAKAYSAYDEEKQIVNWNKIQKAAGTFVSFNLVENKNNDFLNIDTKSIEVYEQPRISVEALNKLYDEFYAEIQKYKDAKAAKAGASALPPEPPPF